MACLDFTSCITSLVISLVEAIGRLVCGPLYDDLKTSFQALATPESLLDDSKKLSELLNQIKGLDASDEIDNWIKEAVEILQKVESSNLNDDRLSCCCCFGDACSLCWLHKDIMKLITRGEGIKDRLTLRIEQVKVIRNVPDIKKGSNAELNVKKLMDMLSNDEVWSIGVWGLGGVGKTTLVNALNNKLKGTSLFDLVIYIPLTKDANENEVQKAISERLKLKVEEGMNTNSVANWIHNRLQRENFLIILDNVWESINLASIGVPENQKSSKVVLTTRLDNVCMGMKAKVIKVEYLTTEEAWQLFVEKAGEVVNDPRIQPLAQDVCRESGDLPLAIVALGSAMRGKTNVRVWENVRDELRCSVPIHGIESKVYNSLKLSYDSLADDVLKSCFLYCSLYPEGCSIKISEVVQCWMAENIIDEQLNYGNAYSKGLDLIENLKNSCLMENGRYLDEIKLHDVVRDVAIWIGKLNGTSTVFSGYGISKSSIIALPEKVENTRWVSFVDNKKIELPRYKKDFPKVTTIHVRTEEGVHVSEEFLKGLQALRVMHLWGVQSSSYSLLHLTQLRALFLRYCRFDLEELQCGAELMVLDLSWSFIYKLPRRVKQPTKLKVLVLQGTWNLRSIEVDFILNLSALEILDTRMSGYKWPTMRRSDSNEIVLQDLSRLMLLKEVYLRLADMEATYEECSWMKRLKSFQLTYGCDSTFFATYSIKCMHIDLFRGDQIGSFILHAERLYFSKILGNVSRIFANFNTESQSSSKVEILSFAYCSFSEELTRPALKSNALSNLEDPFVLCNEVWSLYQVANAVGTASPKLRCLDILDCSKLGNVFSSDYPHMVLPELGKIKIQYCMNITELFHGNPAKNQVIAPKLKHLVLNYLYNLRSLCSYGSSEQWQSLEILEVRGCPNLKKLPDMTSIKEIRGDEGWWNNLEWDSTETKEHFNKFFKPWGA